MTIKDFAGLCGCNPQTLRYYDRVDLLKPARVDPWSGYRFYEEDQALRFVRIRNLQRAGFSIGEIRELLDKDDPAVYQAFSAKIAEAEARLREMKEIRASYQTEMTNMLEKLEQVRREVAEAMEGYDPAQEFGITGEEYQRILREVTEAFEQAMARPEVGAMEFVPYSEGASPREEPEYLDLLRDPMYAVVYEKHGWRNVRDFLDEFSELEDGAEYMCLCALEPAKAGNWAFPNVLLGLLLEKNQGKKRTLGCNITDSDDGQNHFWLLRKKTGR